MVFKMGFTVKKMKAGVPLERRADEGLTLNSSAFIFFAVANLLYQRSS